MKTLPQQTWTTEQIEIAKKGWSYGIKSPAALTSTRRARLAGIPIFVRVVACRQGRASDEDMGQYSPYIITVRPIEDQVAAYAISLANGGAKI